MVQNKESVVFQETVDASKPPYYPQKFDRNKKNNTEKNKPIYSFPKSYNDNKKISSRKTHENLSSSKEDLVSKKFNQIEQSYETFSSNKGGEVLNKELRSQLKKDTSTNTASTSISQTDPNSGDTHNPESSKDPAIFPLSKKKVRFEPGSNDENTPLINDKTHRRPAPISTSLGPHEPPRATEPTLPFIRSKLPRWAWILLFALFLLGNMIILIILFNDNTKSQGIIEQLLSNVNYNKIEKDLQYFKDIYSNRSNTNYSNYYKKMIPGSKQNKLAPVDYIKEQINTLSRFKIEAQTFATPSWYLNSTPIMSIYMEENVSLKHKKDFVVMPFSGNKHNSHHMRVLQVTPKSCSLYHSGLRHKAAILPFPSDKTAGIGVPSTCSEWDLVYSAQKAGAKAVIFYQIETEKLPEFDMFQHPKLLPVGWRPGGAMINIPVIVVSRLVGEILRSSHMYKADVITDTRFQIEKSQNIVAKLSLKNSNHNEKAPFILGSHWDFDPIKSLKERNEFPVTGAVGLLAIARALHNSKAIPLDRPIYLVWFGDRFPLTLGVKAFLDDLWLNSADNRMAYIYFDMGNFNGNLPQIQNSEDVPEYLRSVSQKAQSSMEKIINFEYNQFLKSGPHDGIPTYNLNSVIGEPSKLFNLFGIPTTGLSSLQSLNKYSSHEENVNQLTEITLITLGTLNQLSTA